MEQAHAHEQRQHGQLQHDHGVVGPRALLDADHQQPGDNGHDHHARHVDRDTVAEQHRQLRQPLREGMGHVPIGGGEPVGELDPERAQQGREVARPRDRHGDVADGVLQDQVPTDDPGDQLAERGVGIGVGAARDGDHRGELRVAEARQRADRAEQHEGQHQRRSGAKPGDGAVGRHLAHRRRTDGREDAGPDHRADAQHHQVQRGERALQTMHAGGFDERRLDVLDALRPQEIVQARSVSAQARPPRRLILLERRAS